MVKPIKAFAIAVSRFVSSRISIRPALMFPTINTMPNGNSSVLLMLTEHHTHRACAKGSQTVYWNLTAYSIKDYN